MSISYILPIKWDDGQALDELIGYLASLAAYSCRRHGGDWQKKVWGATRNCRQLLLFCAGMVNGTWHLYLVSAIQKVDERRGELQPRYDQQSGQPNWNHSTKAEYQG